MNPEQLTPDQARDERKAEHARHEEERKAEHARHEEERKAERAAYEAEQRGGGEQNSEEEE